MYTIRKDEEWFVLENDGQPLLTPMGTTVRTNFQTLAERLQRDLQQYGEDPSDPVSIVAFHYAFLDFFCVEPREALEENISSGLSPENEWTFNCPSADPKHMMNWMTVFGTRSTQYEKAKKWLHGIGLMQLCAVCVVGRTLDSVNIPFIVATSKSEADILSYAKAVQEYYPYMNAQNLTRVLKNFLFYFSFV